MSGPIRLVLIDEDGQHIAATITVDQFENPPPSTSRIEIRARGHEGVERMVANAGGVRAEFTVGTSFATYVLELGEINPADLTTVSVAFVSYLYRRGEIDHNLVVDRITVIDVAADGTESALLRPSDPEPNR